MQNLYNLLQTVPLSSQQFPMKFCLHTPGSRCKTHSALAYVHVVMLDVFELICIGHVDLQALSTANVNVLH